jgi:hypothetical protein
MTTNEAAERLRDWIEATFETPSMRAVAVDYLDAALAEERRHVIEQIWEQIERAQSIDAPLGAFEIGLILDDLSTLEQT